MSDWYGFEPDGDEEDQAQSPSGTQQSALIPKHQGIINTPPPPPPVVEEIKELHFNKYRHCGIEWENTGESQCADGCPCCGEEITPYESEALL